MIITDADKIDLAERIEPVVRRHETNFLGAAFADASCHYTQWRDGWCSHGEAMWKVHGLLQEWWHDTFDYDEPLLRPIHPVGVEWSNDLGNPWIWRGSPDFRLPEQIAAGVDIMPLLADRKACGANLVRILAMKANNTGWAFNPRQPQHTAILQRTCEALDTARLYGELTIFADTKLLGIAQPEQQEIYERMQDLCRSNPHIFLELVNEAGHPTQQVNPAAFAPPAGIIASHGSGLSDAQPPQPFWNYATYHARRTPDYPSPKPFTNWDGYAFRDGDPFPLPCPFVCEEGVKPESYDFDLRYARLMGQHARITGGGTFHHNAWNAARLFTADERRCAVAFYQGLGVVL